MSGIITSTKNDFVKHAKSLKSKKARLQHQSFLVEGQKCVSELIAHWPDKIRSIIVIDSKFEDILEDAVDNDVDVHYVAAHVMSAICDCKTPQGIAAIAAMPTVQTKSEGFILALDDVSDPQNVGTMIRTADAAGCGCVVLSQGSADCYSPKAVRASMGSIFHIPVIRVDLPAFLPDLIVDSYHIVSAHLSGNTEYTLNPNKTCLVIGNESRGVSQSIQKLSTHLLHIPMFGEAESLNAAVAAGILMYKIRT